MIEALREILAVFKVDTKDLDKSLKNSNKAVDGFGEMIRGLAAPLAAAFSGAALVGFAHELMETAGAATETAAALGLGVRELQEWQYAAGLSGVATDEVTTSITKLGQKISQAKSGNKEMAATFKALGIDLDELSTIADQSLGDAFEHVGVALAGVEDNAKRTDIAIKLFKTSGPALFNLFKDGAEGIDAMRKEVEELGFAFTDDFANSAEEFGDNMDRLKMAGRGFMLQVLGPIMPDLLDLSKELIRGAKAVIPMVKQFVEFAKKTDLLDTALGLLTSGAVALGVTNFGKLAGVLKTATLAAARFLIPLILIDDLLGFINGDDSVLGRRLNEWFGDGTADKVRASIKEFATEVYEFFGRVKDEVIPIIEEWGPTVLKFAGSLTAAVVAFKLVTGAIVLWSSVMGGVPVIMKAARMAWLLFQVTLFANPFALVAAAIVGALALIVAFWPEISGFFSDLWVHIKGIWLEIKFATLELTASMADAFAGVWNDIISGAEMALRVVATLMSKIPFIGDAAAEGLKGLADGVGDFTMGTDNSEVVAKQLKEARDGFHADVAERQARKAGATGEAVPQYYSLPTPQNFTSVNQDINQKTEVTVNVPPGTPADMANRVGKAAASGAREGSGRNARATQAALVPRVAG